MLCLIKHKNNALLRFMTVSIAHGSGLCHTVRWTSNPGSEREVQSKNQHGRWKWVRAPVKNFFFSGPPGRVDRLTIFILHRKVIWIRSERINSHNRQIMTLPSKTKMYAIWSRHGPRQFLPASSPSRLYWDSVLLDCFKYYRLEDLPILSTSRELHEDIFVKCLVWLALSVGRQILYYVQWYLG